MPDRPSLRPQRVPPRPLHGVAQLLGLDHPNNAEVVVTGVTHDSRQVRPGDLYAALPGRNVHGAAFTAEAIAAGAVAVLTDSTGAVAGHGRPVIRVLDPRAQLGRVAAYIYGEPARDLVMLGITGTDGKTTTAYLVESGLRAAGHLAGLIGTIETRVGDERFASVRTTPEATELHALLAVMRENGATACVMEVSSHALVLGRVDGIVYDVAGFTNLSQDHLDFHADLEEYFAAKAALFTPQRSRRGVVTVDDEYGRRLATQAEIPAVTVSSRHEADWRVTVEEVGDTGASVATLEHRFDQRRFTLDSPIAGDFNVANAALAVVMLLEAGVDAGAAVRGVGTCSGVPGRMERVQSTGADKPLALVDYAHTPQAIEKVLRALRPATRGQLIVVVGAGGDRDPHKRAAMGAASARNADLVIVTDDNPRSEDPAAIRAAVYAGAQTVAGGERGEVEEVGGRRAAIERAVGAARSRADTVVVVGKGHEQGQEIAGVVHPFDDRVVLRAALERVDGLRDEEIR
ncbi:MAG TPA: UDP-N-acetylmuramoyl-L-alanyl-D-glutamate--2,6-diaminopimelate ligase [Jiangellaceae bacterium]|nr:UDP-N-acetylmuramoyl-L-alanyl-D-glutamate--2,6-diaminopimelate ligase [Jiangellaceae bacterium]